MTEVHFKRLPAAVAFQPVLRLTDGREFSYQPHRLRDGHKSPSRPADPYLGRALRHFPNPCPRFQAGTSAGFRVNITDFIPGLDLDQSGRFDGTLILKPDPDYAYQDLTIKSIWNGTLEFPISFSVRADTPTE